jgi:helix-turn-helix protein
MQMNNSREKISHYTTEPVRAGDCSQAFPEFGRVADVQKIFGLKRGTLYNLLKSGRIRGCVLRVKGRKAGVRLIDLASVRAFILTAMSDQNPITN